MSDCRSIGYGSDYTVCPSSSATEEDRTFVNHGGRTITRTPSRCSERSNATKLVGYISSAVFIEKPLSDNDLTEDESSLSENEENSSDRSTTLRICKVMNDPETIKKREEAFRKWLREKKRIENERRLKKIEEEENKKMKVEEELEARRKKSEEKVKQWMERKISTTTSKKTPKEEKPQKVQKKNLKSKKDYNEWLKEKNQKDLEKKRQKEKELREKEKQEIFRKNLSSAFYQKWCDFSKTKPKPVPLNRGFESLAGSTTSIYTNPIPWQES